MERLGLLEAAAYAVRSALHAGAGEAEAYAERIKGVEGVIEAGRISGLRYVDDAGLGVRAVVGSSVGFSFSVGLTEELVGKAARSAVKAARTLPPDPYWKGLPEPSEQYPEPEAVYEPSLEAVSPETVVENLREILDTASAREGVVVHRALYKVVKVERVVVSSQGVEKMEVGTQAKAVVSLSLSVAGRPTPAIVEVDASRVSLPSPEAVTLRALDKLTMLTRRAKLEGPTRISIAWSPQALYDLLSYTLLEALKGDMVARGRSPYAGRVGEQVLSENLTLVDDGCMKGGDLTRKFDGEGVATKRKELVFRGVVRGFVTDTYWARRLGLGESTGNAARSYSSTPRPGYTNVLVAPGDALPDEILEGRVLAVLQVKGAHSSSAETGEYSILASPAVLYEHGEPVGWVPEVMVAGNVYVELAESLELVGRVVERGWLGFYSPWLRVSNVVVSPSSS